MHRAGGETMASFFDIALDECIDRVLFRGESIAQCLARYPEFASELEADLEAVVAASSNVRLEPKTDAKERGRQRLRAEMDHLEREERLRLLSPESHRPRRYARRPAMGGARRRQVGTPHLYLRRPRTKPDGGSARRGAGRGDDTLPKGQGLAS